MKVGTILRIKSWQLIVYSALAVSIIIFGSRWFFQTQLNEQKVHLDQLKEQMVSFQKVQERSNQFLLSTITYGEERQRVLLYLRDVILETWKQIGLKNGDYDKAFRIAEFNVAEAEKYPELDVLMLAALQWQESRFRDTISSPMGAIGICQIMPSTGRMLAQGSLMEYNTKKLYNAEINIQLSARYLDILYATYSDYGVVLAEYNGGPYSAYHYRTKSAKLNSETKKYVPSVLKKWKQYQSGLAQYKMDIKGIMGGK